MCFSYFSLNDISVLNKNWCFFAKKKKVKNAENNQILTWFFQFIITIQCTFFGKQVMSLSCRFFKVIPWFSRTNKYRTWVEWKFFWVQIRLHCKKQEQSFVLQSHSLSSQQAQKWSRWKRDEACNTEQPKTIQMNNLHGAFCLIFNKSS